MNALRLTTGWCAGNSASLEVELPALLRAWLALAQPAAATPAAAADASTAGGVAEGTDWADVQASRGGDGDAYGRGACAVSLGARSRYTYERGG